MKALMTAVKRRRKKNVWLMVFTLVLTDNTHKIFSTLSDDILVPKCRSYRIENKTQVEVECVSDVRLVIYSYRVSEDFNVVE